MMRIRFCFSRVYSTNVLSVASQSHKNIPSFSDCASERTKHPLLIRLMPTCEHETLIMIIIIIIILLRGSHRQEGNSSEKADKQHWRAFLFSKHKVTLVCFFKVSVSGRVTGLIKGYWLCAGNREPPHRGKKKKKREKQPLLAPAPGKSRRWLEIRQQVPSIAALSHWR